MQQLQDFFFLYQYMYSCPSFYYVFVRAAKNIYTLTFDSEQEGNKIMWTFLHTELLFLKHSLFAFNISAHGAPVDVVSALLTE
jgi:hypothetical protein